MAGRYLREPGSTALLGMLFAVPPEVVGPGALLLGTNSQIVHANLDLVLFPFLTSVVSQYLALRLELELL